MLALGDSVTYGTGAAAGEDWPSRLETLSGWRIVNAGIPGDTAAGALRRIDALLDAQLPALVIVEIGGNDFLQRRPPAAVKDDIRQIVRKIRQRGTAVVLLAVPELSLLGVLTRKPTDSPLYAELAAEEGVPLIADVFSDVLGREEWRADQIHPNASGYREMAAGIYRQLQRDGFIQA